MYNNVLWKIIVQRTLEKSGSEYTSYSSTNFYGQQQSSLERVCLKPGAVQYDRTSG
jgi:hypothetical protein